MNQFGMTAKDIVIRFRCAVYKRIIIVLEANLFDFAKNFQIKRKECSITPLNVCILIYGSYRLQYMNRIEVRKIQKKLRGGESNPGHPRDRRRY